MYQHMYDLSDPKERKKADEEFIKSTVRFNKQKGINKPSPAHKANTKKKKSKSSGKS